LWEKKEKPKQTNPKPTEKQNWEIRGGEVKNDRKGAVGDSFHFPPAKRQCLGMGGLQKDCPSAEVSAEEVTFYRVNGENGYWGRSRQGTHALRRAPWVISVAPD